MQDFEKHKKSFFDFVDKINKDDKIAIISHANCLDGMVSAVFMNEILKNKYFNNIKPEVHFIPYTRNSLNNLNASFKQRGINKIFILDLNVDASLFDEFEKMRSEFDVLFLDHHPINLKLRVDEHIIKTNAVDCTSLVLFKFGDGILDYGKWTELACVASISEFSWKGEENLKFIQKYYPDFVPNDAEKSEIFKTVDKLGSLVIYYSKDSSKAYNILIDGDSTVIDSIHKEVSDEMNRCLNEFEKSAESYFNSHLYLYFFKPKFSMGSKLGTILSLRHRGSTIVTFYYVEDTDMIKASGRNNGQPLKYSINEMCKAGISGLDNAMAGGHAPASGASFMKKDLEIFKKQVIEFVKMKIEKY